MAAALDPTMCDDPAFRQTPPPGIRRVKAEGQRTKKRSQSKTEATNARHAVSAATNPPAPNPAPLQLRSVTTNFQSVPPPPWRWSNLEFGHNLELFW